MTVVVSEVGSQSGAYHERTERDIVLSPRSDLIPPPHVYTRWNPYRRFNVGHSSGTGTAGQTANGPEMGTYSAWGLGYTVTNVSVQHASTAVALSRLVDAWKNSDVNLGVSIGEGKESLGMVASSLRSLAQSAIAIRRGDIGGAVRHFKNPVPRSARRRAARRLSQGDLSGSWLALNLGWAPMISDIYAATQFVRYAGGYAKIASKWAKGTASATVQTVNGMGGKVDKAEARRRYVTVIRTPPTEYQRLGLTNPALVAWELVPFSFVVDYFLPIGDVINAMSVLQMNNSNVKTFQQDRAMILASYPARPKGSWMGGLWAMTAFGPTRFWWSDYNRQVASLSTKFVASTITTELPTSLKKVANMAALLHQSLLSLRK